MILNVREPIMKYHFIFLTLRYTYMHTDSWDKMKMYKLIGYESLRCKIQGRFFKAVVSNGYGHAVRAPRVISTELCPARTLDVKCRDSDVAKGKHSQLLSETPHFLY